MAGQPTCCNTLQQGRSKGAIAAFGAARALPSVRATDRLGIAPTAPEVRWSLPVEPRENLQPTRKAMTGLGIDSYLQMICCFSPPPTTTTSV